MVTSASPKRENERVLRVPQVVVQKARPPVAAGRPSRKLRER